MKECSFGTGCSVVFQTSAKNCSKSCTDGVLKLPASGAHNPAPMQTSERARGSLRQAGGQEERGVRTLQAGSPRVPRTPGRHGGGPVGAPAEAEEGGSGTAAPSPTRSSPAPSGGSPAPQRPRPPSCATHRLHCNRPPVPQLRKRPCSRPRPTSGASRHFRLHHAIAAPGRKARNPPFRQWLSLAWIISLPQVL